MKVLRKRNGGIEHRSDESGKVAARGGRMCYGQYYKNVTFILLCDDLYYFPKFCRGSNSLDNLLKD